jgi:hypothetical protein
MAIAPVIVAKISMMMSVRRTVAVSTWRFSTGWLMASILRFSAFVEVARSLMELVVSVMAFAMEFSDSPTLGMAAALSMSEDEGERFARVASVRQLVFADL